MKISIIVPVFNGEQYISRCLRSLCSNELTDIEIIIINDGSTDKSQQVIEEIAEKDNRIRCYNLKNSGVSNARNIGIKQAIADYIMFCDCDDEFEPEVIPSIYNKIKKTNYSLIEFNRVDVTDGVASSTMMRMKECKEISVDSYLEKNFSGTLQACYSVVNKVYSADIIKKHNIHFDTNLKINEDLDFNLKYLLNCGNVLRFPNVKYIRHCNSGSAMFSNIDDFFTQCMKILEFENNKGYIKREKVYKNFILHYSFISIDRYLRGLDSSISTKKHEIDSIKEYCKKHHIKMFYPVNKRFIFMSFLMFNTNLLIFVMSLIINKR